MAATPGPVPVAPLGLLDLPFAAWNVEGLRNFSWRPQRPLQYLSQTGKELLDCRTDKELGNFAPVGWPFPAWYTKMRLPNIDMYRCIDVEKKYADGRPVGYPIYLLPSRKADIKRDGHPSRQLHLPHARIELPGIILICGSLFLRHARFFCLGYTYANMQYSWLKRVIRVCGGLNSEGWMIIDTGFDSMISAVLLLVISFFLGVPGWGYGKTYREPAKYVTQWHVQWHVI